jgi:hypothetical protein
LHADQYLFATGLAAEARGYTDRPGTVYRDAFGERGGWGAWFGTGTVSSINRQYRSYDEASAFVHPLRLKEIHAYSSRARSSVLARLPKPARIQDDCTLLAE